MGFIGAIFSGIFGIISAIFALLVYILSALGLHTMSKNYGLKHAWIAWIPICQWYLIGELINDKIFGISNAKWILVLTPIIVTFICSFISNAYVVGILQFCVYLLEAAAYYKLFQIYKPDSAVLYLISGIIISPLLGLWVFLIRNNQRHALVN